MLPSRGMNPAETENSPTFELLITKFTKKYLIIKLYQEANSSPQGVKYMITFPSSGVTHEGVANDEGKAFAQAIEHAGYAPKTSALREIKHYYNVKGHYHKIGNIEFKKVVRKALA